MSSSEHNDAVEIPHTALGADTLRALIEEFITRAGTDYGAHEASFERKIADIMRQLEHGETRIVFDSATGTANIVLSE